MAKTGNETDHVYKVIELVGTSEKSIEDAIQIAIGRATKTLKHLRWFEVIQTRGHIENGKIGRRGLEAVQCRSAIGVGGDPISLGLECD